MGLTLIKLTASTVILLIIYFKFDVSLGNIKKGFVEPGWLIASVFIPLVVVPSIVVNRWKLFLFFSGIKESFFELYKITHVSQFWGLLLPSSSGFIAIKMYLISKKHPDKSAEAGSTVVLEKGLGFIMLSVLGILGTFTASSIPNVEYMRLTIISIFLILLAVAWIAMNKRLYEGTTKLLSRIRVMPRVFSYLARLHRSMTEFPMKAMVASIPLILMFQLATILNVYILFRAMGSPIPFYQHLAIMPLIYIIALVPVSISGFGIREGGFVYFYGQLGVDPSTAFAVSIVNYLILGLIPATIGGILTVTTNINKRAVLPPDSEAVK